MTAPAKAAPMREDVTPEDRELFIFLLGFDAVADVANFHRIRNGEFDHWEKMQTIVAYRLAHTARPNAVSMDAKADSMDARPDAGDEDVERVACAIYNEDSLDGLGESTKSVMMDRARAALAAMREGVDRGMVEVPREPTEAMVAAALGQFGGNRHPADTYRLMLEAAALEQPR